MYDIQGNKSNLQLADVLKEGSYLLYDFNDINLGENENQYQSVVQKDDANHGVVTLGEDYKVSPLFHLSTVNDVTKAQFIEAITEEVPYYHAQSTAIKDKDSNNNDIDPILYLSDSRDPSVNDVHAALQEDDFWHEWFTNIWGREQNKVIRLAYNTLRWPFLSDTQYLNATKFADLLNQTAEAEGLSFDTSDEAVEELNEIVDSKLQSAYSLFNYTQLVPQFLDDWAESLWRSGACTRAQAEREKTIFKLQDLKNEILRRKFAGSSIVYQMILSSIGRQGTLAKTTMLSEEDGATNWSNGRPVRDLNFHRGPINVSSYVELVEPEDGIWSSIPYNQKAKWKCSYKGEDVFFKSSVDVNDLEEETEETEGGVLALEPSQPLAPIGVVDELIGQTEAYTEVDLGTLNWTYNSENQYFYTTGITDRKYGNTQKESIDGYTWVGDKGSSAMASVPTMSLAPNNNSIQIKVKDTRYTSESAFKSAMSGVILRYDGTANTLHHSMTEEVKSEGKNLISDSMADASEYIPFSGYDGKTISASCVVPSGDVVFNFFDANKTNLWANFMRASFEGRKGLTCVVPVGTKFVSFTRNTATKVSVNIGSDSYSYTPYVEPSTLTIPSSWYSVEDIGIEGTVIDLEKKTVTWTWKKVDLGTLDWSYSSANDIMYTPPIADAVPNTENLITTAPHTTYLQTSGGKNIWLGGTGYTNASAFKSAMSGVELVYELAEPVTMTFEELGMTPIDPQIRIEGGGTISVVSEGATGEAKISYYPYPAGAIIPIKVTPAHEGDDYEASAPYSPKNIKVEGTWKPQYINSYVDFSGLTFTLDPYEETLERIDAITAIHKNAEVPLDLTLPMFYESTIDVEDLEDPSEHLRGSDEAVDFDAPEGRHTSEGIPSNTVLDIQADHVLYHQNSIHRAQGAAYDLPTFNDNSLSLMDSSWIDYIEALAKERQRPSENIKFGAQISLVDTKEDVELSVFSFANNTLKYGSYNVTTLTASNREPVVENGETYTFYKGTVPFISNTVECEWQCIADSNLFRFQYDGDKWSDWFNASETSATADGVHWLAHNYFVGRATITHQGDLDPDKAVSIVAFNSSKSDDPEVVFGMKNVLDEAEITPIPSSMQVVYGKDNLEKTSYTALNTIIAENPVKQRALVSHATITATSDGMKVEANLPNTSSADVKYTADVTPDLNVSADINFADANMLGENIRRTIQDGRVQVAHHVRSTKAANSNYLVIPTNGHREVLTVKNVTLSSIFNTLCSAESYYTEMKYPVPVKFGGGQEIAYRWTGIRTLKEGEYYITCKYPVIYTACNDEEFAKNEAPIPAVYASRFKIVVEGTPADLRVKDSMDLDPALNNYTMANIESQIRKADAEDNYRLPHRTISIKLYVLDGVDASGNPQWSLIGANADILANGLIDLKDVSRPLTYSGSIKMFSTASYRSGLYVNDENGAVVWDGQDADVDEDKVYNMVFDYTANITELSFCDTIHTTAAAEKADYARSVNLLNNDVLTGDYIYTGSEADWSKEQSILTSVKAGFKVTDNEFEDYSDITLRFTEYAKANNLIYFDTTNDVFKTIVGGNLTNLGYYIYDISEDDELPSNPPSSADSRIIKPSTFEDGKSYYKVTTLEDDTPIWEIVLNFAPIEKGLYKDINGVKTLIDGESITAGRVNATTTYYTAMRDTWVLGDPYSQSSARNGLLDLFGNLGYRRSVNNCPFISYLYEGMFTNDYRVSTGGFRELTYATDGVVKKSELSFAQAIYNGLRSSIKTAIQNLTQNAGGVFANIGSMESNGYTIDALDKLYKRTVVAKNIPITNLGELVERDEVYGNNLIVDQNFDNIARWNISKRGMYKSVNSWKNGKDIYCFSLPEDSQPLELTYKFETALTSLETENSICIKGASAVAGMTRTALDSGIYGEGWYLYSYQGEDFVSADGKTAKFTITPDDNYAEDITITNPTTGEDETVSRISVYVTKVVVRTNNRTSWTPGLSNTVNRTAERILTLPATPILYTSENHRPLLLKSIASSNEEGMEYAATPASKIITLTGGRELLTKDGYTEIVKPWEKRVEVELPASNLMVYSYSASNNLKRLEGASDIALIAKNASLANGVLTINLEADEYLDVLNATIASSGNVDNEDLTGFNGSEMTGTVDEFVEVHDEKNGDLIAFNGIRVVQNGSVIVEFNFLPIVLNRRKHHLSVNILLKD